MTEKTIYEQVKYSYNGFCIVRDELESCGYYVKTPYGEDYVELDRIIVSMEFERFKSEYPDIYKKALGDFLKGYIQLKSECEQYITTQEKFRKKRDVIKYVKDIDYIVDYLEGMLTPEDDTSEAYVKLDKLPPIEKLLILHYLGLDTLKLYQFNLKAGAYFLTHLFEINPESIKNPISKLDDYTSNNKLTAKQARSLYPVLERVKEFFDESELSKVSLLVDARIIELKMKSGSV